MVEYFSGKKSGIRGQRLGQYFTEEYVGLYRTTMAYESDSLGKDTMNL